MCVLICLNVLFLESSSRGLLNPSSASFGTQRRTSNPHKYVPLEPDVLHNGRK